MKCDSQPLRPSQNLNMELSYFRPIALQIETSVLPRTPPYFSKFVFVFFIPGSKISSQKNWGGGGGGGGLRELVRHRFCAIIGRVYFNFTNPLKQMSLLFL